MPDWKVIEGDCVEQMRSMPEAFVAEKWPAMAWALYDGTPR